MDASYLNLFLDEAVEILSDWEKACFNLELGNQTEATESLYRGAHNLKSGSAAVGFADFSTFIHKVEDLLSSLLTGRIQSSPAHVRFFLDVHTVLITWMAGIRTNTSFIPLDIKAKAEQDLASLTSTGSPADAAPDVIAGGPAGQQTSSTPPSIPVPPPTSVAATDALTTDSAKDSTKSTRPMESVRVPANKLDFLIQLVGDLSTQQAILWHGWQNGTLSSKSCDNAIQLTQKNCKELQGIALSLRMQPLEPLFQRLERAARDLARKQGKKIDVKAHGDHVELDKVVIERVTEALMHVIRNAIDHGIEDPKTREDLGKPPVATLRLEGSQEPGGIVVRISEDGRGLNLDRILKKAIEKGLARADQSYSDAEIQRFIFLPGFSTADKISDVSGRGVGMDVVKTAVQSIGGGISISSTEGRGTTFSISLPTTMSIVDSLIIRADGNSYAIPLQDVAEIIDLSSFRLETAASKGRMLSLRSMIIPVEHLREHLPKTAHRPNPRAVALEKRSDSIQPALLIRAGTDTLAFQVDHVVGQQSVSIRPLPGGLEALPGYTGATILGDGDPCVILNLPALARLHIERIDAEVRAQIRRTHEAQRDATDIRPVSSSETASTLPEQPPELRHLVFQVHPKTLATPLLSVREIISDVPYSEVIGLPDHVLGRIDLRGQILPVVDLGRSMRLRSEKASGPLIVVDTPTQSVAVVVDRIEAVADLVVSDAGQSTQIARYRGELITTFDLKSISDDLRITLEAS